MSNQTITFGDSAVHDVIEELGFDTNDNGVVVDEDGPVPSLLSEQVTVESLAGFMEYEGELVPIKDDFSEMVVVAKERKAKQAESNSEDV